MFTCVSQWPGPTTTRLQPLQSPSLPHTIFATTPAANLNLLWIHSVSYHYSLGHSCGWMLTFLCLVNCGAVNCWWYMTRQASTTPFIKTPPATSYSARCLPPAGRAMRRVHCAVNHGRSCINELGIAGVKLT